VQFAPGLAVEEVARVIEHVEARIREVVPAVRHVYIEAASLRTAA